MQNLHPVFVHFPVAVIPLAVVLGLWSLVQRRNPGIRQAFRLCLLVAVVFALGAYISGHDAARAVRTVPGELLEAHEEFGTLTFVLVVAAAFIELVSALPLVRAWSIPVSALAFTVTVAALFTTVLAGHRGAEMVYRYGAGVGTVFSPPAATGPAPADRPVPADTLAPD